MGLKLDTQTARALAASRRVKAGGRPGVLMPCGWCRVPLKKSEVLAHWDSCTLRPPASGASTKRVRRGVRLPGGGTIISVSATGLVKWSDGVMSVSEALERLGAGWWWTPPPEQGPIRVGLRFRSVTGHQARVVRVHDGRVYAVDERGVAWDLSVPEFLEAQRAG